MILIGTPELRFLLSVFLLYALLLGVYTGNIVQDDQNFFVTERHCMTDLLVELTSPCNYCGLTRNAWTTESLTQVRTCNLVLI